MRLRLRERSGVREGVREWQVASEGQVASKGEVERV